MNNKTTNKKVKPEEWVSNQRVILTPKAAFTNIIKLRLSNVKKFA